MGIKAGIYLLLFVVAVGFFKWFHGTVYQSGRNDCIADSSAMIIEAQRQAVEKARAEWENTAAVAAANIVVEEKIVEVIRIVEKEIPTVVERIVTLAPDCADLGPDFARLLNEQIRAGTNNDNQSSAPATIAD